MVSANQLAMCILIAVLKNHDAIIQILPSIKYVARHPYRFEKGHILNLLFYIPCYLLGIVLIICKS